MSEKPRPLSDLFDKYRSEQELQYEREQIPGTAEHARASAFTLAFEARTADKVERVKAAGGVIGVTHTEQGEPLEQAGEEARLCSCCECVLDDDEGNDDGMCEDCAAVQEHADSIDDEG